jgi:hypothetical protein
LRDLHHLPKPDRARNKNNEARRIASNIARLSELLGKADRE